MRLTSTELPSDTDIGPGTYGWARLNSITLRLERANRATPLPEGAPPIFARNSRRVIQRWLEDPFALAVLEGVYTEGDTITVDALEGVLTFS